MKVGLSLSYCVSAILRGEVLEEQVHAIVASTICPNKESWEQMLQDYKKRMRNSEPFIAIANRLWDAGKIIQPRIGDKVPSEWGVILNNEGVVQFGEMGRNWIDI